MLQLKNITLYRGQKCLLADADLTINNNEKVGIVGSNGVGKSSLFKLFQGKLEADKGECSLPTGLRIAEIKQEEPQTTDSALHYVLAGDTELASISKEIALAEAQHDGIKISEYHQKLAAIDGYSAESRAAKILNGLGFNHADHKRPVNDFSGGWRMRLNLAQVLMTPCDLLLLDEPTNHLDLEAIFWLETWLSEISTTALIISHDRDFLDNVVNRIVYVTQQKLLSFGGNYSKFEETYALQLEHQNAAYIKQQKQINHSMQFVERFRYKATKARQAQSRLKLIERMEKVAPIHLANPFNFCFKPAPEAGNPMITLRKTNIGYGEKIILKNVSLSIHPGDRIAFIGPNGTGKSTLIKAIAGELAIDGESLFNPKIRIGYFTQHQVDSLNLTQHAVWHIQHIDRNVTENMARQFLGGFNFNDDRVFEPVSHFSGGEKARLALALLVWQQPNLLLLDEPSNHLDMEMRQALMSSLQNYDGALILIAHDRYLLNSLVDEFYLLNGGQVQPFEGTLKDYQQWFAERPKEIKKEPKNTAIIQKKSSLSPTHWQKQFDKKEIELAKQLALLMTLESKLADHTLYQDPTRVDEVRRYQSDLSTLKTKINTLEEDMLLIMEQLG